MHCKCPFGEGSALVSVMVFPEQGVAVPVHVVQVRFVALHRHMPSHPAHAHVNPPQPPNCLCTSVSCQDPRIPAKMGACALECTPPTMEVSSRWMDSSPLVLHQEQQYPVAGKATSDHDNLHNSKWLLVQHLGEEYISRRGHFLTKIAGGAHQAVVVQHGTEDMHCSIP